MDKLEKALKKARHQRNNATDRQTHAPTAMGPPDVAPHENQPSSTAFSLSKITLNNNRIVSHHTRNKDADIFRLLRTQILQAMAKDGLQTLAVTSANYGEGKTTIALNLAVSIAMDLKQTALIVDLDLRKPYLHKYLGITPTSGLTNYLLDDATIPEIMIRLPFERLTLLPAGNIFDNSSEIIGSHKMASLAQELKERYPDRFIIYDMPPILEQDDPLTFLPHADAALVVIKEGVTQQNEILRCQDMLRHTNVIGTILNDCV